MEPLLWPFNFSTKEYNFLPELYKALENDDSSVVVITALQILRKIKQIPLLRPKQKCQKTSELLRKKGNEYLKLENYQEAMIYYNNALMFASNNSYEMKLALGNRSLIFLKKKQYAACVKDINMALSLSIPNCTDIDNKLETRLEEANMVDDAESIKKLKNYSTYGPTFFNIPKRNPDIPCASSDIGVLIERRNYTIVAKNDIEVGTVLAIEEAFTLGISKLGYETSCYYCSKIPLNLIPCLSCCRVLFCDAKCRQNSLDEGHHIECQIIDIVEDIISELMPKQVIKTVLKIRQKCKDWKEFIEASRTVGRDRWKNSSLKEIFDGNEMFSLLCCNDDRLFVYGLMCNTSFACATVLHYLETVKNYLPSDVIEKQEAMRALARLMIFLVLHTIPTRMNQHFTVLNHADVLTHTGNSGSFSFIGKLRHACTPNACTINLNRKMVVVALEPIKAGAPITIHYLGNNVDTKIFHMNDINIYSLYGMVCNCILCTRNVNKLTKKQTLDEETKKKMCDLMLLSADIHKESALQQLYTVYPKVCSVIAELINMQFSDEYVVVKLIFLSCLATFADYECGNKLLVRPESKLLK